VKVVAALLAVTCTVGAEIETDEGAVWESVVNAALQDTLLGGAVGRVSVPRPSVNSRSSAMCTPGWLLLSEFI